ncbi:hypothetical protein TspCOW1_19380 [Thiohalobacter sp. COW1]|uniref:Asp-tRNA Asn/Glu-tRNA Gln amidotransferase A subunit n=1 Tax=Thiohalobacter thiocyanaticus TaxID=585455 RepID=A0A1Z4VNT4_9GAMM|nr:Asp-tRNA Asn/Glu-tRNA Gln amidotransferase A subunit [Thiohalobacter thiocyanaticus]BCO31835.1 hypothetical protein TspCOW1_19380 [Thiohalobacter sp. COW1]
MLAVIGQQLFQFGLGLARVQGLDGMGIVAHGSGLYQVIGSASFYPSLARNTTHGLCGIGGPGAGNGGCRRIQPPGFMLLCPAVSGRRGAAREAVTIDGINR